MTPSVFVRRACLVGLVLFSAATQRNNAVYVLKRVAIPSWTAAPSVDLQRDERTPKRNVLLVSIDTLRADHMSLYGYERVTTPAIDAWFADGVVYEKAYAPSSFTPASVVSALSGQYPQTHGIRSHWRKVPDHLVLLSDILRSAGWNTAAVVANPSLSDRAIGFGPRFDSFDDQMSDPYPYKNAFERIASNNTDSALAWLASQQDSDAPHMLWVHYMDPHAPYAAPSNGPARFEHEGHADVQPEKIRPSALLPGVTDALDYVDRYDEEIAYTDQEIGRLLEFYEDAGYAEHALVILFADHGESMIEREEQSFEHDYGVYEELVRIPLAVRGSNAEAGRVQTTVTLMDIAPSVLQWLGFETPTHMDGMPFSQRKDTDIVFVENGKRPLLFAAIQGTQKWFARVTDKGRIVEQWATDLSQDPDEATRGAWTGHLAETHLRRWIRWDPDHGRRELVTSYRPSLAERLRSLIPDKDPAPVGLTDQERETLQALGYLD